MTVAESWNLVAGGPSRANLRKGHLLEGPVVTVNRAIDIVERGIDVDFAAFSDGPGLAWRGLDLERHWRPGMILWVSAGVTQGTVKLPDGTKRGVPGPPYAKIWDQALPASVGFRLMPYGILKDEAAESGTRTAFTTFCAFHGILRFKPKAIRILCMDMAGSWVEGWTEETCHAYDMEKNGLDRWTHERRVMEREINKARSEGIRVEVMSPAPEVVSA